MNTPSNPGDIPGPEIAAVLTWLPENSTEKKHYIKHLDTIEIGRDAGNDVVVNDKEVSRRHAIIVDRGSQVFEISDLGSTNGTRVNGKQITNLYRLSTGDKIHLGSFEINFSIIEHRENHRPDTSQDTLIVKADKKQPRLIVTAGKQEGREFTLGSQVVQIGRETSRKSWDIALQDRSVSRPHVELKKQGEDYILEDLQSANGTILNGKDVLDPRKLKDGDVIIVGETTLLYRVK